MTGTNQTHISDNLLTTQTNLFTIKSIRSLYILMAVVKRTVISAIAKWTDFTEILVTKTRLY